MRSDINVRRLALAIATVVALSLAAAPIAGATTYSVNTTSDTNAVNPAVGPDDSSGHISLRSAIEALNTIPGSQDLINVPAGTYRLTTAGGAGQGTTAELLLSDSNGIRISGGGASSTTIDANYLDRALEIGSGTAATISGLTIKHGRSGPELAGDTNTSCPATAPKAANPGGGILDRGTLTLTNDTFTDNMSAGNGGAVDDQGGLLTVAGSIFSANHACHATSLTLDGSGYGGAIDESGNNDVKIDSSTISGNTAQADGGGVTESTISDPTITITNSTISSNHTDQDGGGIAGEGSGTFSLFADLLSANTATRNGGGIGGNDRDQVVDTTITGNFAGCPSTNPATCGTSGSGDGGGIENAGSAVTISFSTINNNNALGGSGGNLVNDDSATFALDNSIVTGGIADGSAENCADNGGAFTSNGHNLFDDKGTDCADNPGPASTDLLNKKPKLGALADNGGPTKTEALLKGSPAVDAASAALCQTEPVSPTAATPSPVDQRGISRPQGPGCDIGAFEAQPDVGLTGTAQKNPIIESHQDTVTWVVTNDSPAGSANVVFTDPAVGYTINSVNSSQGTCAHTTTAVTCHLGLIGPGAHVTINVVITGQTPGTIVFNGKVTTTGTDLNPNNNHATVRILVKKEKTPPPPPPPPPPPHHHHHRPPRPTISMVHLGSGCHAENSTFTIVSHATARGGINTFTVEIGGHVTASFHSNSKLTRHKTLTSHVRGPLLVAGRTYTVVGRVVDSLGRGARVTRHFTMCRPHASRGFTG